MRPLSRRAHLIATAILVLGSACVSDPVLPDLDLDPLPGILEVSTQDLTIASDRSTNDFKVTNAGELPLHITVTVTGGALRVAPETFNLDGGETVTVVVSVEGERRSSDVIIEADNGNAAIIDVDVKPLQTERASRTVVDATTKISAGVRKSWSIDVPEGGKLSVSMSAANDYDTWLFDDTSGDRVPRTTFNDTLRASYEVGPLTAGPYTLVVSNVGAWFFSRTVTVLAELQWDKPIPARN